MPDASANYLVGVGRAGVKKQPKQVQPGRKQRDLLWTASINKGVNSGRPGRQVLTYDTVLHVPGDIDFEPGGQ